MNFLASPMLVVVYALVGTMHVNLLKDSLGKGSDGKPVYLRDIWPSTREIQNVIDACVQADLFTKGYADVFAGDDNWRGLDEIGRAHVELQSLMRISYAVFCLNKTKQKH